MTITIQINGREIAANFVTAGNMHPVLMLDMPYGNSENIQVYKVGRKWVEAYVVNKICRRSKEHATRQDALNIAAEEYARAVIDNESFVA